MSLFFLFVLALTPEGQINSLVLDVMPTLEECATKKQELEHQFAERLKENPNQCIECLQLMGTV